MEPPGLIVYVAEDDFAVGEEPCAVELNVNLISDHSCNINSKNCSAQLEPWDAWLGFWCKLGFPKQKCHLILALTVSGLQVSHRSYGLCRGVTKDANLLLPCVCKRGGCVWSWDFNELQVL